MSRFVRVPWFSTVTLLILPDITRNAHKSLCRMKGKPGCDVCHPTDHQRIQLISKCPLSPSPLHMKLSQSYTLGQKGWLSPMTVLCKWAATAVPATTSKQTLKTSWCSSTPPKTLWCNSSYPFTLGFTRQSLKEPTLASNPPCGFKPWSPHHGLSLLSIVLLVSSSARLYVHFLLFIHCSAPHIGAGLPNHA